MIGKLLQFFNRLWLRLLPVGERARSEHGVWPRPYHHCRCGRAAVEPGETLCGWCSLEIKAGDPLPEHCLRCGMLRHTVGHASYCRAGYCDDPNPTLVGDRELALDELRSLSKLTEYNDAGYELGMKHVREIIERWDKRVAKVPA